MNTSYVIKKALLSEKAYASMEKGVYTFLVKTGASKYEIKKAVEKQFGVSVQRVNVLRKFAKKRKVTGTRREVLTGQDKKALVHLKMGESISMLSPKKESKAKSESKNQKVNDAKKTEKEPKEIKVQETKKGLLSRFAKTKQLKEGGSK